MRPYGNLWVFIGPYVSLWVLMCLCGCLCVFTDFNGSLWVFEVSFASFWILIRPYMSL